jgi:hypothetical protein
MVHVREIIKNIHQIRTMGTICGIKLLYPQQVGLLLDSQTDTGVLLDHSGEMDL